MMMKTIATMSVGLACLIGTAVAADAPAPKPGAPKTEAPKAAEAPKAEAPKAPSPEAVAAGKKIDWATMDVAAKKKYMKATVLPTMKKLFVAFNKKTYSKMNCLTCHGEKGVENKFKMPNAELPKLPGPTDRAGFMALAQKKPEAAKFMGTEVKPTMAALLGKPEWEPSKPDGFGCYACHTKEESAAATPPPPAPKPGAAPGGTPPPGKGW